MLPKKTTAKGKTAQEGGLWFQDEIHAYLKELEPKMRMRHRRLYDTRSTQGGALPEQDGDFLTLVNGREWLIEVKASLKFQSLGQSRSSLTELVAEHQAAAQRLQVRAGGTGMFIFHQLDSPYVEIWDGNHVGKMRATPKEHLDYRFHVRVGSDTRTVKQALADIFSGKLQLINGETA